MPSLICCGAPLSAADPGAHLDGPSTAGVLTDPAIDGTRLNPHGNDVHLRGDPVPEPVIPTDPFPYHNVAGYQDRAIRMPIAPGVTLHRSPYPDGGGQSSGAHGQMAHTFGLPDGQQTPLPKVAAKSWRAPAAPYDNDVYYGWTPVQGEGEP